MRLAPSLVMPQEPAGCRSHAAEGFPLADHHVLVEGGWPAHGLASVVDDEVQPIPGFDHLPAERLHAGRVAKVKPENLEAVFPVAEVGLGSIPIGGLPGKPGGDDEVRAGPQ